MNVVIEVMGEEDNRRLQRLVRKQKLVIRLRRDRFLLVDVREEFLRSLLKLSWQVEWLGEIMWICIGPKPVCQRLFDCVADTSLELKDLVKQLPVLIERGHDAAHLCLYSDRYDLADIKRRLSTILPSRKFLISQKERYSETSWIKSWQGLATQKLD